MASTDVADRWLDAVDELDQHQPFPDVDDETVLRKALAPDFVERQHPRDRHGQFRDKPGVPHLPWIGAPGPPEPEPGVKPRAYSAILNRWAKDTYGKRKVDLGNDRRRTEPRFKVYLDKTNPDFAYEITTAIHALNQRFPAPVESGRLRWIGNAAEERAGYVVGNAHKNAYAWWLAEGHGIEFNEEWWGADKDPARALTFLNSNERTGWHPGGTGSPEGVATHEFGHVLDDQMEADRVDWWRNFRTTYAQPTGPPSRYALMNTEEMMGETFASALMTPESQQVPMVRNFKMQMDKKAPVPGALPEPHAPEKRALGLSSPNEAPPDYEKFRIAPTQADVDAGRAVVSSSWEDMDKQVFRWKRQLDVPRHVWTEATPEAARRENLHPYINPDWLEKDINHPDTLIADIKQAYKHGLGSYPKGTEFPLDWHFVKRGAGYDKPAPAPSPWAEERDYWDYDKDGRERLAKDRAEMLLIPHPLRDLPAIRRYREAVSEMYAKDFADGKVRLRVPLRHLNSVLKTGKIKNQHEIKVSRGHFDPTKRALAEHNMYGLGSSEAARIRREMLDVENEQERMAERRRGWGYSGGQMTELNNRMAALQAELANVDDMNPDAYPKYGYLTAPDGKGDTQDSAIYGGIHFIFKDSIKDRTTYSSGDSLNATSAGTYPNASNALLTKPQWFAGGADPYSYREKYGSLYPQGGFDETQTFGKLGVDDIAEVVFSGGTEPTEAHKKKLAKLGIPYRIIRRDFEDPRDKGSRLPSGDWYQEPGFINQGDRPRFKREVTRESIDLKTVWREALHPRDREGHFVEVPDDVYQRAQDAWAKVDRETLNPTLHRDRSVDIFETLRRRSESDTWEYPDLTGDDIPIRDVIRTDRLHNPTLKHEVGVALSDIGKVHRFAGTLRPVPVIEGVGDKDHPDEGAGGYHFDAVKDPDWTPPVPGKAHPIGIGLARPDEYTRLAALHETGHYVDQIVLGQGRTASFWPFIRPKKKGKVRDTRPEPVVKAMKDLFSAIKETDAYKEIEAIGRNSPDPYDEAFASYMAEPPELFARAYAQYIAFKTGDDAAQESIMRLAHGAGGAFPIQWEGEDFAPLMEKFDALFEAAGLLRKKGGKGGDFEHQHPRGRGGRFRAKPEFNIPNINEDAGLLYVLGGARAEAGMQHSGSADLFADRHKMKRDDYLKAVNAKLRDLVKEAPLRVRVPYTKVPAILDSGRLKNQHEAGSSEGAYAPTSRRLIESRLFKMGDNPIYGYADTNGLAYSSVSYYGNVVLTLKPHVRKRTTVMFGDTYDVNRDMLSGDPPLVVPTGLDNPSWISTHPQDDPLDEKWHPVPYAEIQVHDGGISLDDIESAEIQMRDMVVTGMSGGDEMLRNHFESLAKKLRDAGIPATVTAKPENDSAREREMNRAFFTLD